MATPVERAEQTARGRALACYVYATTMLLLLLAGMVQRHSDFLHGMWLGLTATALLVFLPLWRWLRPGSMAARLLDDESAREHRRMAATAGFCAATVSSLVLETLVDGGSGLAIADLGAAEVARIIATAGAMAALAGFATLELRAAQ